MAEEKNWIDEDDEDYLPPPEISGPDANGIKIVVEYRLNDDKEKVKITRRYKVSTVQQKVSKKAILRNAWRKHKFGESARDGDGPNFSTTAVSLDEVLIDDPNEDLNNANADQERLVKSLRAGVNTNAQPDNPRTGGLRRAPAPESNVYIPPALKDGGSGKDADAQSTTLRITNLTPETTDEDVRALCAPFGKLSRVFLAKDRETGLSKGFAYVSFTFRRDAEKALESLERTGYNHVILHVEWAKPTKREDGGPPVSRAFMSGYGRALPQGITRSQNK